MKNLLRIAGVVLLLVVLDFAWGTPTFAQGPTATPPSTACTNVATFVTDVTFPDNAAIAPGQAFTKIWRLRNRGTCTWGDGYTLNFVSGQAMTVATSIAVPGTAAGVTVNLSVPMTAPTNVGLAKGFWQLKSPSGVAFGPRVWVQVNVGGAPQPGLPALAPALVSTASFDDPGRAMTFGNAIPSLSAGSAEWLRFDYDNGNNALPRPTVTVVLIDGAKNGLSMEIYSPEIIDQWFNNKPVGRGTPASIENCYSNGNNIGTCSTNDLSWTGGFGLNGTYYVRIINNSGATVAPELVMGGSGLASCTPSLQPNSVPNFQGQPYAFVQCQNPNLGTQAP